MVSILKKREELYSDIRRDFMRNPITGDITRQTNEDAINESLQNLIVMTPGEDLIDPAKGAGIRRFLFEHLDKTTLTMIENVIKATLKRYEPRVSIMDLAVIAEQEEGTVHVVMTYYIVGNVNIQTLDMLVKRTR